jgi:hypothetical protein
MLRAHARAYRLAARDAERGEAADVEVAGEDKDVDGEEGKEGMVRRGSWVEPPRPGREIETTRILRGEAAWWVGRPWSWLPGEPWKKKTVGRGIRMGRRRWCSKGGDVWED